MPVSKSAFQAPITTAVTALVTSVEATVDASLNKGIAAGITIPLIPQQYQAAVTTKLISDYQSVGWTSLTITKPTASTMQVNLS